MIDLAFQMHFTTVEREYIQQLQRELSTNCYFTHAVTLRFYVLQKCVADLSLFFRSKFGRRKLEIDRLYLPHPHTAKPGSWALS